MSRATGKVVLTEAQRAALDGSLWRARRPRASVPRSDRAHERGRRFEQAAGVRTRVDPQRVRRWRCRWAGGQPALDAAESAEGSEADLADLVFDLLCDEHRAGPKPKFSPE